MTIIAVTELKNLPTNEHYAALIDNAFTYDDGYSDRHGNSSSQSTHKSLEYICLGNAEQALEWLRKRDQKVVEGYKAEPPVKIIRVTPVEIQRQVHFNLKDKP